MTNKQFAAFMLTIILFFSIVGGTAQSVSSSVLVFPAVPLSSCTIPPVANWTAAGYIALCNTTTGLAFAESPSTTFNLIGAAGVTSFNGRTGAITLGKTDVLNTGIAVSTTVTATSTPQ